jgi:hypothetical protein
MRALKKKPIQIYLQPDQDKALEVISKKKGISKAAIIRLSLDRYLKNIPLEDDPALKIIDLGKSGRGDLAERHDDYIAGYSLIKKKR